MYSVVKNEEKSNDMKFANTCTYAQKIAVLDIDVMFINGVI